MPLAILTAVGLLMNAAAVGQDECRAGYICFERGEARLESPEDVTSFLVANHEKLGLTGNETFRCRIQRWIGEYVGDDPPPEYAYICVQPFVQGVLARYLDMRVDFWSRNDGVRSVRCRCVREDIIIPRPMVARTPAEQRGRRYIYAHFPEVPRESIAVVESQDPVVQLDWSGQSPDGFRLARNVLYHFPLFIAGRGTVQGELRISIDALDESVLRAVDEGNNLRRWGIFETAMEAFEAAASAMPLGEARFDASQRFYAFRGRGEIEVAVIEERLGSMAHWEPDGSSRYRAYFSDATAAGRLATFLEDYELSFLMAGFWYLDEDQLRGGSITATPDGGNAAGPAIRAAFHAALAQPRAHENLPGLADLEDIQFNAVEFQMRHADALRLYETELGKRILTLLPLDRFATDQFLDIL